MNVYLHRPGSLIQRGPPQSQNFLSSYIATLKCIKFCILSCNPHHHQEPYPFSKSVVIVFVVQSLSVIQFLAIPWNAAQSPLSYTISQSLLKLMSIESMMLSNCLILCRPLLLVPSVFPSIRAFSRKSALLIRWPKYWSFSFRISPSEYSGLISFRIDWFDFLAVQGTLYSLLQYHNS